MAWVYHQTTGILTFHGRVVSRGGYSGWGRYKNDPTAESIPYAGPIPRGWYRIGKPYDDPTLHDSVTKKETHHGLGPHVMELLPDGHNARGRTLFRIHGDNRTGTASNGCIILPPDIRQRISQSGLDRLLVDL